MGEATVVHDNLKLKLYLDAETRSPLFFVSYFFPPSHIIIPSAYNLEQKAFLFQAKVSFFIFLFGLLYFCFPKNCESKPQRKTRRIMQHFHWSPILMCAWPIRVQRKPFQPKAKLLLSQKKCIRWPGFFTIKYPSVIFQERKKRKAFYNNRSSLYFCSCTY